MFFRGGAVTMVWNDSDEVKCQCGGGARRQLLGNGVEDVRREAGNAAIAGEEIGAEHELETLAVEAHVSVRVAGKMDCPQAVPNVDEVAIIKPAAGSERMEG